MPKCEGRFVGMDETEVEVNGEQIDGNTVTAEITINRLCNNCGAAAMTVALDFEATIDHKCDHEALVDRAKELGIDQVIEGEELAQSDEQALIDAILDKTGQERYELDGGIEAEPTDRNETTDRHGKPIKNPRYQKHYIGASIVAPVRCNACGDCFDVEGEVEEAASGFEDTEHSG